jgi:hypothetical protein
MGSRLILTNPFPYLKIDLCVNLKGPRLTLPKTLPYLSKDRLNSLRSTDVQAYAEISTLSINDITFDWLAVL